MKKIFSILAATIMVMAMVSCEKDNDNGGGGENTNNFAQVGDLNTPMTAELFFSDFGEANFNASYNNASENIHVHFSAGIAWNSLGKTFDLTSGHNGEEFWFRYEGWADNGCEFTHRNKNDGTLSTWLNQSEQMTTPVFSSGTMSTARTSDGYSIVVDGTLTDGTKVLIKLNVPFEGEVVPLTRNSVIYDGVKYEFTTTASSDPSTSNVTWNSTGDNGVSSSGTVFYGSNNLGIFLQDNPTGDGYYFNFEINAPNLQLSYNWHNDQLTGTFNGVPFNSTPFTSGEASISAYYHEMQVTVIGTLNNGKELKLCIYSPY